MQMIRRSFSSLDGLFPTLLTTVKLRFVLPMALHSPALDLVEFTTSEHYLAVHNTMGAAYIGVICAACLYGVSCVQTWFYFTRYSEDPWYIKFLVFVVWIFDSIHQALVSHTVYFYVITNFANYAAQANLVWSILLEVLFNGLIGLLVQSFLTIRVWRYTIFRFPY
ncbi:hypothetical protein PM082_005007 [Marasmius tenuissimus]|nr:hypothetical protein PM082_005007 [Marasmius tenuissimus]